MFTPEEIKDGEKYDNLGPAYMAARASAERFMAAFEAEHFKPLIDKFVSELSDRLWSDVSSFLISDTENNLQSEMWRHADNMVEYVLSGEEWAMKRFVLGERYDCEKIRAKLAAYVPKELQDARIADLEKKVAELQESNEWLRRR